MNTLAAGPLASPKLCPGSSAERYTRQATLSISAHSPIRFPAPRWSICDTLTPEMAVPFLELHVLTKRRSYEILPSLKDAIVAAGGWVTGYREFSNRAVCVNFEIEERHCQDLFSRLRTTGCVLDPRTIQSLSEVAPHGERTCMGTLQVTLLHDDPDQKTHIPAIPG